MDRRERLDSLQEMLIAAMAGNQSNIWTALPGIIQGFDRDAMTCTVQPSIRARITQPAADTYTSPTMIPDASGLFIWDQLPLLLDCPVVFPGGGGVTLTFPLAVGDECLVVFSSRCIDAWWQNGGIQNTTAVRMHDLSDGFVLPGVRSQPRRFTVSDSATEIRSDDGATAISINAQTSTIAFTCASLTHNGVNIGATHVHGGVSTGTSNTEGPE